MRWRKDGVGGGGGGGVVVDCVLGDSIKEVEIGGESDGGSADWRETDSGGDRSWGSAWRRYVMLWM